MFRIDDPTAAASPPGIPAAATESFFSEGSPGSGIPATRIRDWWLNMVQEELRSVVVAAGLTPSKSSWSQVSEAVRRLAGANVRTLTANTVLTAGDAGLLLVDASGGNRTHTLPAANAANGRPLRFAFYRADATANAVTIQRAGADTIEGATSVALSGQGAKAELWGDGVSGWIALAGGPAPDTVPAGTVLFSALSAPPPGYVRANGALLSRMAYSRLFAAALADGLVTEAAWNAGSTGRFSVGDGSTTFRIPDLRGEFLRGFDDGRSVDTGRAIGSRQDSANLSHDHSLMTEAGAAGFGQLYLADIGTPNHPWVERLPGTGNELGASGYRVATFASGGAEARPRNVALLACLKF